MTTTTKDLECYQTTTLLWDEVLSFIACVGFIQEHDHACYKIVVALKEPISCQLNSVSLIGAPGYISNQRILHGCHSFNDDVLVLFISPDGHWGQQLKHLLTDKPYLSLTALLDPYQLATVLPLDYATLTNQQLAPFVRTFLENILVSVRTLTLPLMDERIKAALAYIDQNLHLPLTLDDLGNQLNLSPERARHLFVQQTGYSFTQYIIWKRIRKVLALNASRGINLAEASVWYGFTDQSHFNQRFKRMFGIAPSLLIKGSRMLT